MHIITDSCLHPLLAGKSTLRACAVVLAAAYLARLLPGVCPALCDPATMADYTNAEAVLSLRQTDVNKMTNAQLKTALNTLLASNDAAAGQVNNILLVEMQELRKQVTDLQGRLCSN